MLSRSIQAYEKAVDITGPVFFDRGIAGLIGYCRLSNLPVHDNLLN